MKPWPTYTSKRGRLWDGVAGFITALIVNALFLLLIGEDFYRASGNWLPWVINSLFILVFLVVLPWFALGYLLATALTLVLPLIAIAVVGVGCLAIIAFAGLSSGFESFIGSPKDVVAFCVPIIGGIVIIWILVKLYWKAR